MAMSLLEATLIIETSDGEGEGSVSRHIEAWSYIIHTRAYRHLQGSYGRAAERLILDGIFSHNGEYLGGWDE